MRRGLTLIELLVALAMSAFIIVGSASAYVTAINFERQSRDSQDAYEHRSVLEQRIRALLGGAYVSADANDPLTYFNGESSSTTLEATSADSLTFTTLSEGLNGAVLGSSDDFETLNSRFGPQGGIAEISISTTPVGASGEGKSGLFVREQRPADGDPSQGGTESVLDPDVKSIQFEFYNGSAWDPAWSTSGQSVQSQSGSAGIDGRRIPSAVRVTYALTGDADDIQHSFIVRLFHSDVSETNPVVVGGTP